MNQSSITPENLASCTETELLDILSDLVLDEDCSKDTLDQIDICLAELDRRFPAPTSITASESLKDFHRKHPELFEDR